MSEDDPRTNQALADSPRPGRNEVENAVRTLLRWAGDDPAREGLVDTPARVARAFEEFFAGYRDDPVAYLERTFEEVDGYDEMVGERVSIWLNGKHVVDHTRLENYFGRKGPNLPVPRTGPIQLQTHGGEIRWRNIHLREIGSEEANKILASHGAEGFASAFNGKDFTGWAGATGNYEVVDGTLRCKAGKGGVLYTKKAYADFAARLEFKLPPGGNNGLAIRYPGSGDAAYGGMCELQVLDNTAAKYAKLNPKQYHGSVYAQIAAHRGYLRPVGEWNFQQVTVQGHRIRVELNGTVILDADVSKNDEFMYKPEKFKGRLRTEGHFGFAGHNDPVQFRNIQIKSLD